MLVGPALYWLALLAVPPVETRFVQVAPRTYETAQLQRFPNQFRAVVLIHGLRIDPPLTDSLARKATLHGWQQPASKLVRAVGRYADVYAFAYGQNLAVDQVASLPALADGIRRLGDLGYQEIILIGHSAGGIIARDFVEDHPGVGVTKVIQVCTPNTGSSWARDKIALCRSQAQFLDSLTKEGRQRYLRSRVGKKIPDNVEFVCLVGTAEIFGDGIVLCSGQWPDDLQMQGIPAVTVAITHFWVMRTEKSIDKIVHLVREYQPRWTQDMVQAARRRILKTR